MPAWRHGSEAHSSNSLKHVPAGTSVKPAAHVQVYLLVPCVQVAPFKHGVDAHSLMSVEHTDPEYPALHVHWYEFTTTVGFFPDSAHVAPFLHGDEAHSLMSVLHVDPEKPALHTQLKVLVPSTHVAPFTHGYEAHSFRSTSQ